MDHDIIVKEQLDNIELYLKELDSLTNIEFNDYKQDIKIQRFSERTLHIMIEEMLNVAKTIIDNKKLRQPTSYNDAFTVLFEQKIIPSEFYETAKDIADFGHRLIYDYKDLNASITFAVTKNGPNDIKVFVKCIRKWLSNDNIMDQFA
jgi:uncharacterized protein YutE (UPF0331/DUF86 family)